jgi:hypothetical protein
MIPQQYCEGKFIRKYMCIFYLIFLQNQIQNYKKVSYSVPLWTRWYTNGISYTILPQINWELNEKNALFIRYEMNFLRISKNVSKEWNQDVFFGFTLNF